MRVGVVFCIVAFAASCSAPVHAPPPVSGEAIAFGAGPSGARNACFTCHGLDGAGRGSVPRLAGIDAGYLTKQMFDYASEERYDPIMGPIARAMTDRDIRMVSHYYADLAFLPLLSSPAPDIYAHGDRRRGLRACADCHGNGGQGLGAGKPPLAGQPTAYTIEQLRRWRRGERRNDPLNVMSTIARSLSDDEIEAIAAYLSKDSGEAEFRDAAVP